MDETSNIHEGIWPTHMIRYADLSLLAMGQNLWALRVWAMLFVGIKASGTAESRLKMAAGSGCGFTIRQRQSDGHDLVVTDPCHARFAGEILEISIFDGVFREKYAKISQVSDVSGPIPWCFTSKFLEFWKIIRHMPGVAPSWSGNGCFMGRCFNALASWNAAISACRKDWWSSWGHWKKKHMGLSENRVYSQL